MTLGIVLLTHLLSLPGQAGASLFYLPHLLPAAAPTPTPCGLANIDNCFNWVNDPIGFIVSNILQGPFSALNWLLTQLMTNTNFQLNESCVTGQNNLGVNCVYYRLWQVGMGVGMGVLVVAAAMRALREMMGERARPGPAIIGTIVRFVVVFGAMSLSYTVLAWASNASFSMFSGLFGAFATQLQSTQVPADLAKQGAMGEFTYVANAVGNVKGLSILYILDFVGMIYVTWLILVARFVLIVGVAFAPIVIALSVYSEKSAIFIWWTRKMLGALLTPVFAGAIMGVTTAIVWNIVNASDITTLSGAAALSMTSMFTGGVNPGILLDILMGTVAFIGGCWFLGQAIKHTTGINLGAHSLSTMVAGGIGLAKLAPMASGAFGMGAKAMGALRGTQQGSSLAGAAATNPQAASVSGGGNLGLASPSGGPSIGATLVNQPQAVLSSFQEAVFSTPDQGKSIIEAAVPASTLAAATAGLAPGSPEYKQAAFTAYAQTERAGQDFSLITMGAPRVSSMA